MGKIVGILQPSYLPWLGCFEQMHRADVFVFYDDVQFEKGSWRNRNRVKTPQGPVWLTVPVLKPGGEQSILDVRINPAVPWAKKHLRTLEINYAKAPYAAELLPELADLLDRGWPDLCGVNLATTRWLAGRLGITTPFLRSSELGIAGRSTDRLIRIIRELGGDVFYEGAAGRNYIDPAEFEAQGIGVQFQDYRHPQYRQLHGPFVSHLSVVDLLFNHGPSSLNILTGNES